MTTSLVQLIGNTDIYLLDQIMKGRYVTGEKILDAGCGSGRNLHWFLQNNFDVYGIDVDADSIALLKKQNPSLPPERFGVMPVEKMIFKGETFNHIICSAVLHFAKSTTHFQAMMAELVRVLKRGGTLFLRMTSNIGLETLVQHIGHGVYNIPDGSTRFLLTKILINDLIYEHQLSLLEPLKTVNVDDKRCMSTLVLQKT